MSEQKRYEDSLFYYDNAMGIVLASGLLFGVLLGVGLYSLGCKKPDERKSPVPSQIERTLITTEPARVKAGR